MVSTNDLKKGMTIIYNDQVHQVVEFQHVKPGKGGAFVRTKLKNMETGQVADNTFKAKENIDQAMVERRILQYLYKDNVHMVFMDMNTFEQLEVPLERFDHLLAYLKENEEVTVVLHEGRVLDVVLPYTVELKVVSAMPGAKGDTATGATKPVEVETGATIQVPLFVEQNDVIKVDTRTGEYLTRV